MPSKERMEQYKAEGRCPNCSQINDRDGYSCTACTIKHRAKSKAKRKKYREEGRCPRCSKPLDETTAGHCPACTLRRAEYPFGRYPHEMEI